MISVAGAPASCPVASKSKTTSQPRRRMTCGIGSGASSDAPPSAKRSPAARKRQRPSPPSKKRRGCSRRTAATRNGGTCWPPCWATSRASASIVRPAGSLVRVASTLAMTRSFRFMAGPEPYLEHLQRVKQAGRYPSDRPPERRLNRRLGQVRAADRSGLPRGTRSSRQSATCAAKCLAL